MVPTWLCWLTELWNKWAIRIAVSSSLMAHIILLLLADTRRHNVWPGWTLLLWLAYQALDIVGGYALGHLSLDNAGDEAATESEQLLVAFWAPFLLLHLGGPDNIGAYSLDDDKLSWRKVFGAISTVLGTLYIVLTKIWLADDSGLLRPASIIMVVVGILRFSEKVLAIAQALRRKIQGSSNKKPSSAEPPVEPSTMRGEKELSKEDVGRIAQRLFESCGSRILFDSSVEKHSSRQRIFSSLWDWKDTWEVVETEASKIYDMLYTKAGQVHTWRGYLLRLLSPLATAIAGTLFCLYPKDCVQQVDVVITYVLLSTALVLDVVWLVTALASTSAYAFLEARPGIWFCREILRRGWWHRLRRTALLLHPWRLVGIDPSTYRLRSGSIGRYDLLRECTRAPGCMARLCSWLGNIFGQDDAWNDYRIWKCLSQLPEDVKELLFKRTMERLDPTRGNAMEDIRAHWGQEAVKRRMIKLDIFGREFQEDILLWHIGTTIYLWSSNQQQLIWGTNNAETTQRVKAIEAVSEYLMFLATARPHMLPDPALRRLYEVTQQALQEVYNEDKANDHLCCASRKNKLADTLLRKQKRNELDSPDPDGSRRLISDAAELAIQLQAVDASRLQDVVELLFDVWVHKLLYAGIRCSRESHARQLGRGGELVTIAWIVAEEAGVFRIGEGPTTDNNDSPPPYPNEPNDPDVCPNPDYPLEPLCPDSCCMKDYSFMQQYYYC